MRIIFVLTSVLLLFISCNKKDDLKSTTAKNQINELLNQWHKDVANYDYESYFNKMTADAVFVGTAASEVWSKQEFQDFSRPFFDKKQTWNFKPVSRNIYIKKEAKIGTVPKPVDLMILSK